MAGAKNWFCPGAPAGARDISPKTPVSALSVLGVIVSWPGWPEWLFAGE